MEVFVWADVLSKKMGCDYERFEKAIEVSRSQYSSLEADSSEDFVLADKDGRMVYQVNRKGAMLCLVNYCRYCIGTDVLLAKKMDSIFTKYELDLKLKRKAKELWSKKTAEVLLNRGE
jgi:hypothetical protein